METEVLFQVDNMPASEFFPYATELMQLHPPHVYDWTQLARLERLGIVAGETFDYDNAPPAVRAGLDRAIPDTLQLIVDSFFDPDDGPDMFSVVNGWQIDVNATGVYGTYYFKRAVMAKLGLGANLPEDSIYPNVIEDANGDPVVGGTNYVMRFEADEIPPVSAFWSITLYDEDGFQVPNALNRFAIGDRDPLLFGDDGSLELYIQPESPGADKEANWLPSTASGQVVLQMRLYAPRREALDGRWNPPVVRRVE